MSDRGRRGVLVQLDVNTNGGAAQRRPANAGHIAVAVAISWSGDAACWVA